MIIDEGYLEGVAVAPPKADPPLVVHADAVLTSALARKLLEVIPGGHPQVVKGLGRVHDNELSQSRLLQDSRPTLNALPSK